MVRAEAPLVHCWCPVVFRHSGHHKKWANVSIISSGEGLHSATTLLKSRVNSSQLPSDSFFLNIHLHFWHAERRKEGELTRERERERGIWSWNSSSFSHFTSVRSSCQDPGTGSQSQTIPAADAPSDSAEPGFYLGVLKQSSDLEIKRE